MATIITRASKGSQLTPAEADANLVNLNNAIAAADARLDSVNTALAGLATTEALAEKQDALGFTPENPAQKNVANGYAGLDGGAKIPAAQLPSYVDDVLEYATAGDFPVIGESGKIYLAIDSGQYRWTGSIYVLIPSSPGTTDVVLEGSNLYFTAQRVRDVVLTGLSLTTNAAISATDSALSALGKLQRQVTEINASINSAYMALVAPGDAGNVLMSTGDGWVSSSPTAAPAAAGVPTGATFSTIGSVAPTGYVMLSGRTIGNAASAATERANADTEALFTLLWASMANTEAAVSGGRGASAAADYAANKTITLPDARGRAIAGVDSMGGTTAGRLTSAGAGIVGKTLGASGGAQTHVLTIAQMPSHIHTVPRYNGDGSNTTALAYGNTAATTTQATSSQGSSAAHQNTQPTLVLNIIVKL